MVMESISEICEQIARNQRVGITLVPIIASLRRLNQQGMTPKAA
jgi:hypothetical protein